MRLLILAAVVSLAYGHTACPALWTHFQGYCWKMFPDPLRRADAETTCGQFAPCSGSGLGQLATPSTPDLNSFLKLYASQFVIQNPAGFEVWTSMTDAQREGMFVWGDGKAVTTTMWKQGQPDNGRNGGQGPENCGTLNSVTGLWSDANCQAMNRYICQMTAEVERVQFPGPGYPRQHPPINPQNPQTPFNPQNPQNPNTPFNPQNPNIPQNPNPGNPGFPGNPI